MNVKTRKWLSWAASTVPVLILLMSGGMKLAGPAGLAEQVSHLGWPLHLAVALGILEVACVAVYLYPQTSVLGAILVTGYLGGAIATHVRLGEPFVVPLALGVLVWLGLFLREPRLRALLPLRTAPVAAKSAAASA